jgi:hypothetical protein
MEQGLSGNTKKNNKYIKILSYQGCYFQRKPLVETASSAQGIPKDRHFSIEVSIWMWHSWWHL